MNEETKERREGGNSFKQQKSDLQRKGRSGTKIGEEKRILL